MVAEKIEKQDYDSLMVFKPYDESILSLKNAKNLFQDEDDKYKDYLRLDKEETLPAHLAVYKVKYTLNLLPSVQKADQIMDIIGVSENIDLFETEVIKGMIEYKWNTFAY